MGTHRVSAEAVIVAPPDRAFAVLADYRVGHPGILPRPPFVDLVVEEGGVGAGTVIRFRMRAFGVTRTMRAAVTEPDPGRVLVETDVEGKVVTTVTVDPADGGRRARVTISTDIEVGGRLLGWLRRRVADRLLRPVYLREIANLEATGGRAQAQTGGRPPPARG
jgi:hypothetical protein